jgi:hypothetical protein
MSVREYTPPAPGASVPLDVALAHQSIDINKEIDRNYLNAIVSDPSGDAPQSWLNFRRIGEVRYAVTRSARLAGYNRFVAAEVNSRGEIVQTKDSGVEAELVQSITSRFGGVRGLMERYYTLMQVPGQGFLTKVRDGLDGTGNLDGYWVLSASEVQQEGDVEARARAKDPITWRMKRSGSRNGNASMTRQIRAEDFLGRLWTPDHEFTQDVNSPLQSINSMCEQLNTLTESISGRLRQRFTHAGILLIPNEINDAAISGNTPTDGKFSHDKVMNYLIHVMTTNVVNHAQGMAAIPILLKGPAAVLDMVRHITEESTIAETDLTLRAELIGRILTALDQPSGSTTDGEGENHWRSWKTADDERRIAVVPHVEAFCHALTRMTLWPQLEGRNRKPGDIMKWVVWYDLSRADVRANQEESARQLWDRVGVSTAYLRGLAGAGDDDAPVGDDYVRQVGVIIKNPILACHGLEGVEVDWDRAAAWGKTPGPTADSPADEQEVGPGTGDPGSPNPADRDSDKPKSKEPA